MTMPNLKLIFDVGVSKKAEIFFKDKGFDILSKSYFSNSLQSVKYILPPFSPVEKALSPIVIDLYL